MDRMDVLWYSESVCIECNREPECEIKPDPDAGEIVVACTDKE